MNDRSKGLSIVLFGVLCVSPDALLVRYLSTHGSDPWTIIFWKLLLSIPISASFAVYEAGGVRKLIETISSGKRFYVLVVPVQCVIDIGFTLSFAYTSAAVALLLINLNPLWGAIIGKIVLKDVLPIRTYIALALALGCMMVIFIPEMVSGEQDNTINSLRGNLISLFTGFLLAVYLSIVRKAGKYHVSLVGGTPLGAALSTIVAAIVTKGQVNPSLFWDIEMWKFWLTVIAQGFSIGIIFITMAIAPRFITAPEIGLCTLLEAILGPLFVFFAYHEIPSQWTLIGGSLLLCVLAIHESRPLFEKSRDVYRSMSKRFSSKMIGDTVVQDIEASIEVNKSKALTEKNDDDRGVTGEMFVEENSMEVNGTL